MNTRNRIFFSSIFIGLAFFLMVSPVAGLVYDFVTPPAKPANVRVIKTAIGSILVSWDLNGESDIKEYRISRNEEVSVLPKNVNNRLYDGLGESVEYLFKLVAVDDQDRVSESIQFDYAQLPTELFINKYNVQESYLIKIIISAIIFSLSLYLLTAWSLFFKVTRKHLLNILLLPTIIILPYLLLTFSTIESVNMISNKLIASTVITLIITIITYVSLLTTNILNAATSIKLPLEQAGKATHFILSLISTYLILIYSFGSYQNILQRILILLPFVYIYTYILLYLNNNVPIHARLKAFGISLVILLTLFVASIWPIELAYAILLIAVIYYILLNLALEIRVKYTRSLWVEYISLISLILILFLTTSNWGINYSVL